MSLKLSPGRSSESGRVPTPTVVGDRLTELDENGAVLVDIVVGRQAELSVLGDVVGELARGVGRVVWLDGEAGIGKSTLVDVLAVQAARLGSVVFRSAGDELAQRFPLRLIADCLNVSVQAADAARAGIARLIQGSPDGAQVSDPVLAASERILELVDRMCATGLVLVVVEDLHWADEPSLAVWNRLSRTVDQLPLLLVGTARPVPRRDDVARLKDAVARRAGVVIELGPLDAAGVVRFAGHLLSAVPGQALAGELWRAGGNPLYVRELVAALVRDELIEVADGAAELLASVEDLPGSLGAAIGRRLGFLGLAVRNLLSMAALLGNDFDVRELALVTGQPAAGLVGALEEARAGGVLMESGDRLAFRHALIRQALVEGTPASLRVALHGQFARLLAQAGAEMDVVVRHLLSAPGVVESWLPQWLAELPESVLLAAPEVAADLLARAVRLPADGSRVREVLTARLATVLFWLGDYEQVEKVAGDLARTATDPPLRGRMWMYQVSSTSRLGRQVPARAVAFEALRDTSLPESWQARIRALFAATLVVTGQVVQAREQASLVLAQGQRHADSIAVAYAHNVLSLLDDREAALAHANAGLAGLDGGSDAMDVRFLLLGNRVIYLIELGRREEFDAAVRETLMLAAEVGTKRISRIQWSAAMGCFEFGAWDDALVQIDSMQPPLCDDALIGRHGMAALIAAHREDWPAMLTNVEIAAGVPITASDVRVSYSLPGGRARHPGGGRW